MGKVARLKGDLDDVDTLLEIITVLKDVAANRFFVFVQRKSNYEKFLQTFFEFFAMLGNVKTKCPLIRNDNPGVDLLIITSDLSFMAQLNSKVCTLALKEYEKYPKANLIMLGKKSADRCRMLGMKIAKIFTFEDGSDRYDAALEVRDYLISRVMSGESGKTVIVYVWAKTFSLLKPRVITLLPASELISIGEELQEIVNEENKAAGKKHKDDFILETPSEHIMEALADIWIHARLVETINDLQLVEFAATSQQLESAIEGLSGEKKGLVMGLRKAGRDELNKSMREVFTSTSIARKR